MVWEGGAQGEGLGVVEGDEGAREDFGVGPALGGDRFGKAGVERGLLGLRRGGVGGLS